MLITISTIARLSYASYMFILLDVIILEAGTNPSKFGAFGI
jgi:hypothetical protein